MNSRALTSEQRAHQRGRAAMVRDYWELIRPRIVALVLFTLLVAAVVSGVEVPPWTMLVHALAGNALVIVGAIALNQRLEGLSDAKMLRTARRPLPSGRLTAPQVSRFAAVTSAAGLVYLAVCVNWVAVLLAAVSWLIYVWVYTPLKALTAWQTPIGAVAGAMPALLGAAAAGAPLGAVGLALFGVVYFWQFPHAMAIAWLYRREFARAELRLITVVDPTGRTAGVWAALGAIALVPVSLVPCLVHRAGWGYGAWAAMLGAGYLAAAIGLWRRPGDASARRLLWVSIVYLPVLLAALLVSALV
jgi:protoheme IX farnesyltransferase